MKRLSALILAILMLALPLCACEETQNEVNSDDVFPSPDFSVMDENKKLVKLSDMKGKPIVVNCWASWTPYCTKELQNFDMAYKEYGDEVAFMMINLTDGAEETLESAHAYLDQNNYSFPVYYDINFSAFDAYKIRNIPLTLFFDANGTLIIREVGMLSYDTLTAGINKIK